MADDFGDKTEAPTPKRRQEARDQGKIPRSRDIATSALLVGSMVLLKNYGPGVLGMLHNQVSDSLGGAAIIFISSDAVETCGGTAYARQKAAAEAYMRTINAAIIRPGRIAPERAREFAAFVVDVALSHRSGIHRWR